MAPKASQSTKKTPETAIKASLVSQGKRIDLPKKVQAKIKSELRRIEEEENTFRNPG